MAVQFNDVTRIGDSFVVRPDNPLIGVTRLSSYTDTVLNETGTRLFEREFRYSTNGVTYSDWTELTDLNLQSVFIGSTNTFNIEYQYTRGGTDETETLTFISIELTGEIQEVVNPTIYKGLYFNKFFNYNDETVINWALNVLNKLYAPGIVAKYLERGENNTQPYADDDDFNALFGALTHFFAILVRYAREFKDFTNNQELLTEYLRQKSIFLCDNTALADLQTLLENLYINMLERGTNEIVKADGVDGRTYDGELLRLICKEDTDEFIFGLIERELTIWNVNNNSPLYRGTKGAVNLIKAYEFTQDLVSLANYPLVESTYITAYTDTDFAEDLEVIRIFDVDSPSGTIVSGIGDAKAQSKLILIDPRVSYEITFQVRQVDLGDYLHLKVDLYDEDEVLLTDSPISAEDGTLTSLAIDDETLYKNDIYYFIRVILFKQSTDDDVANVLDVGFGNHLILNNGDAKYMSVELGASILDGGAYDGANELRIYDFKVRPLVENFANAFVMITNTIVSWMENKAEETNQVVENNIRRFLLPYNTILKNQFLDELYIEAGTPLQITIIVQDETVQDADNGVITINATGGVQPYLYSINDGTDYFTDNVFTNLSPGSYDIRVKDVELTEAADTVSVGQGVSSLAIQAFADQASKQDVADGVITILASGGLPPYAYSIDGAIFVASNVFTTLLPDTYTAYVKDAALQQRNVEVDVTAVRDLLITLTIEDEDTNPINGAIVTITRQDGFNEQFITDINGVVSEYFETGTYDFTMNAGASYEIRTERFIGITADFTATYELTAIIGLVLNARQFTGGALLDSYRFFIKSGPVGVPFPHEFYEKHSGGPAPVITNLAPGEYVFDIFRASDGTSQQYWIHEDFTHTVVAGVSNQETDFRVRRIDLIQVSVESLEEGQRTPVSNATVRANFYTDGGITALRYFETGVTDIEGVTDRFFSLVEGYEFTRFTAIAHGYLQETITDAYPTPQGLILLITVGGRI